MLGLLELFPNQLRDTLCQVSEPDCQEHDMQDVAPDRKPWKTWCIRIFLGAFILAIGIDTVPSHYTAIEPIRKPLNFAINTLGLGQGDWPLFAPNPIINNNTIVAEIEDQKQQRFQWSSPDWSQKSVWFKFHQFRQMNYFQRLPRYPLAYENFANYLAQAVPNQQAVKPALDLVANPTEPDNPSMTKPLRQLTLSQAQFEIVLPEGEELPKTDDIYWSYQQRLLWHLDIGSPSP